MKKHLWLKNEGSFSLKPNMYCVLKETCWKWNIQYTCTLAQKVIQTDEVFPVAVSSTPSMGEKVLIQYNLIHNIYACIKGFFVVVQDITIINLLYAYNKDHLHSWDFFVKHKKCIDVSLPCRAKAYEL